MLYIIPVYIEKKIHQLENEKLNFIKKTQS